jgi:hypothetical protein
VDKFIANFLDLKEKNLVQQDMPRYWIYLNRKGVYFLKVWYGGNGLHVSYFYGKQFLKFFLIFHFISSLNFSSFV